MIKIFRVTILSNKEYENLKYYEDKYILYDKMHTMTKFCELIPRVKKKGAIRNEVQSWR